MNEKATIVADTREFKSGIPERLSNLGLHVNFSMLSIGDYLAGTY
ncbi:MAG: ERCC4 domain-containing protein [Thermoplasmata archaeon]